MKGMATMRRLLVLGLVASLGNAPVAFAGETLLSSGTRIVRDLADTQPPPVVRAGRPVVRAQDTPPGIASSGLRKRTKIAIALGAAAAFAAVAMTIDRKVENTTPSSLGTRQDK
jgi:hypothetical protein